MSSKLEKLILFPGLGADERLFSYQNDLCSQVITPEWLPPENNESLASYAYRFSEYLDLSPNTAVGGMSFGGQLALEMAKGRELAGVVLIAANRRSSEISPQFRLQNKMLQSLPESLVRSGLKTMGITRLKSAEDLDDQEVHWLTQMLDDMDFNFFKWSSHAVATWNYEFDASEFRAPIYQVHGENDWVIQLSDPKEAHILKGAGHLINYTHAKELNQWIKDTLAL